MSLDFTTLVANTIERLIGSDGSPYEKRVDAEGHVASDKCIANEIPFEELPEGWCWTRLGNLLSLVSDGTHKTPQYTETGVLFLSVQNVSGGSFDLTKVRYISRETHEDLCRRVKPGRGDILLCRIGTLGKPIIVDVDYEFSIFVSLGLLRPVSIAIAEWICSCIDSPVGFAWIEKVKVGGGTHTFKINLGDIPDFILPLPPLAEQRRIVERVNQLMPLVEEYGGLEDAREALDAALPGRLRKSVLQLAVQGGLVPQDPADEPAGVLLERIRGQRRQLVAEGKMRAPKGGESIIFAGSDGRRYEKRVDARGRESDPACIEDEIPFEIPEGWEWARLESVIVLLSGTDLNSSQYNDRHEGIPYLTGASNFTDGKLIENRWTTEPSRVSTKGELLFTCKGTVGEMAINRFGAAHIARQIMSITPNEYRMLPYISLFLNAMVEDIKSHAKGVIPGIERNTLLARLIPVPPLAEESRIAEKYSELLNIII